MKLCQRSITGLPWYFCSLQCSEWIRNVVPQHGTQMGSARYWFDPLICRKAGAARRCPGERGAPRAGRGARQGRAAARGSAPSHCCRSPGPERGGGGGAGARANPPPPGRARMHTQPRSQTPGQTDRPAAPGGSTAARAGLAADHGTGAAARLLPAGPRRLPRRCPARCGSGRRQEGPGSRGVRGEGEWSGAELPLPEQQPRRARGSRKARGCAGLRGVPRGSGRAGRREGTLPWGHFCNKYRCPGALQLEVNCGREGGWHFPARDIYGFLAQGRGGS